MSRCPQCNHENPPGARFCNGCGARAELACAQCSQVNPSGSRFCNGCGAQLGDPGPAGPQPRFTSPESYTPKHLAERILNSKTALEGERKQVTVLFADLKGSMELLADRDPEEARKLLDPVLTRMQDAVRRYSEELRRAQGVEVQIRVGVNSGDVVVRSIGSDLRMDYTAVGQTTHLAARMEQLAAPGSTLLAPATLQLAEGYVQAKALGPMVIKGLAEPIEVYELTGAGTARSRLQAAASRGLTRFVGRDAELEQLRAALEKAGQAQGQVVAVVGEPGVGKSRLSYEFTRSHRTRGWL